MDFEFNEEQQMVIEEAEEFRREDARPAPSRSSTRSRSSTSPRSSSSASSATWA